MCHHYQAPDAIDDGFVFDFRLSVEQRRLYRELVERMPNRGAWPLKLVPGLRLDSEGELRIFGAEWGLLPRWWKPSDKRPKRAAFQRQTFNARSETAATKPTFRDAFKRRRCLLPVAEFMEKDHYFGAGEPVGFAGLWESWLGEAGEVETVTLLTTEPNAEVRGVGHHRMPVLLTTPEDRARWITHDDRPGDFDPLGDGLLSVRPAS